MGEFGGTATKDDWASIYAALSAYPRCAQPGEIVIVPGWTRSEHNVPEHRRYTRTEYADDRASVYHRGHCITVRFWGNWDIANSRARSLAAAGPRARVLQYVGREGRIVRVDLP